MLLLLVCECLVGPREDGKPPPRTLPADREELRGAPEWELPVGLDGPEERNELEECEELDGREELDEREEIDEREELDDREELEDREEPDERNEPDDREELEREELPDERELELCRLGGMPDPSSYLFFSIIARRLPAAQACLLLFRSSAFSRKKPSEELLCRQPFGVTISMGFSFRLGFHAMLQKNAEEEKNHVSYSCG